MADFNTIHIFGFGDVQLISKEKSVTKKYADLTKAKAVVDKIYALKPADYAGTQDYHAINIFSDMFADFQPKGVAGEQPIKGFRVKYEDIDAKSIAALVTELLA
jgi:hypothetical protein